MVNSNNKNNKDKKKKNRPVKKEVPPIVRPRDKFAKVAVIASRSLHSAERILRPGMEGYTPPPFINRCFFTTKDGVPVNYYKAEAANEKAIIIGCSGLKSEYILEPEDVKYFMDHGISVLWISLPNPKRSNDFVHHFRDVATELTINPPADIRKWLTKKKDGKHVPKIFMGHSTGAQLFLHLVADNNSFQKLNFQGAVLVSPYIRPTSASSAIDPRSYIFYAYCLWKKNLLPSESPMAKWWMKNTNLDLEHGPHQKYLLPTFSQIVELWNSGEEIIREASNKNSNLHNLPFHVLSVVGEKDGASCPKTNEYLARQFGFAFAKSATGEHDPVYEDKNMRELVKNSVLEMANGTFPEFIDKNNLYAHQISASYLNSLTSLLKNPFSRRI